MDDNKILARRTKLNEYNKTHRNSATPKKRLVDKTAFIDVKGEGAEIDETIRFEPQVYSNTFAVPIDVDKAESDYKIERNNEYQARIRNIRIERDITNFIDNYFSEFLNPSREITGVATTEKIDDTKPSTSGIDKKTEKYDLPKDFKEITELAIKKIREEKKTLTKKQYVTLNNQYKEQFLHNYDINLNADVKRYLSQPTVKISFEELITILGKKPETVEEAKKAVKTIQTTRIDPYANYGKPVKYGKYGRKK